MNHRVKIKDDMNLGTLVMIMQDDGDICMSIIDNESGMSSKVEFCVVGSGGGKSPNVIKKLRELFYAIQLDNY